MLRGLSARPVSWIARKALGPRLRVLAYHEVVDPTLFAAHLDFLQSEYSIVSGAQVVAAARGEHDLPADAAWITFDDGLESTVTHALPLLVDRKLSATLFICPGLVEHGHRPWWDIVQTATSMGWTLEETGQASSADALKLVPDDVRRAAVEAASRFLTENGAAETMSPLASREQLRGWLDAGQQLGNHSWDHPCLTRCTPRSQADQITLADHWLSAFGAFSEGRIFAYPNGDWTREAEDVLRDLEYEVALLFDDRSSPIDSWQPLRTSRSLINASAPLFHVRSVLSGARSFVYRNRGVPGPNKQPSSMGA